MRLETTVRAGCPVQNAHYSDRLLAKQYRLTLIPFFLDGVAGSSSLNQADGIHPTGEGYRIIVEKIFPTLEPLLERNR